MHLIKQNMLFGHQIWCFLSLGDDMLVQIRYPKGASIKMHKSFVDFKMRKKGAEKNPKGRITTGCTYVTKLGVVLSFFIAIQN